MGVCSISGDGTVQQWHFAPLKLNEADIQCNRQQISDSKTQERLPGNSVTASIDQLQMSFRTSSVMGSALNLPRFGGLRGLNRWVAAAVVVMVGYMCLENSGRNLKLGLIVFGRPMPDENWKKNSRELRKKFHIR